MNRISWSVVLAAVLTTACSSSHNGPAPQPTIAVKTQEPTVTGFAQTPAPTKIDLVLGSSTSISGTLDWTSKDSSIPDPNQSAFMLTGLLSSLPSQVAQGEDVYTKSPLGQIRTYPSDVKSVTLGIGNSPTNHLNLFVYSCEVASDPSQCTDLVGESNGPTDVQSVTFTPDATKFYVARVYGSTIKSVGAFTSTELLVIAPEKGEITVGAVSPVSGSATTYSIGYALSASDITASNLLKNPLFLNEQYVVTGSFNLNSTDGKSLLSLPVTIAK